MIEASDGYEVLTLSDDQKFYKSTSRPMYFGKARSAAAYWIENNISISADYEVYVSGPRGGKYNIFDLLRVFS